MLHNNPGYPKVLQNKSIYVKNNTMKTILEFSAHLYSCFIFSHSLYQK